MCRIASLLLLILISSQVCSQKADTAYTKTLLKNTVKVLFNDPDSAAVLCNELLTIGEASSDAALQAKALRFLGIVHELKGDLKESMNAYGKGLVLAENAKDTMQMGNIVLGQGIIYHMLDNYEMAAHLYLQSIEYYQEIDHAIGVSTARNNLAAMYNNLKLFDRAKRIYFDEIAKSLERNDTSRLSSNYTNIAHSYYGLSAYDSALYFVRKSIDLAKLYNDEYGANISYHTLAMIMVELNKIDSAFYYYGLCEDYALREKQYTTLASIYQAIAETHLGLGNYSQALPYIDSSLLYSEKAGTSVEELEQNYHLKANIYKGLGNQEGHIRYLELAQQMADSIDQEDIKQMLLNFEIATQNERLENEIRQAEREKQILEQTNEKQKSWLMFFIVLFLLAIIAAVSVVKALQLRTKYANVLTERTKVLELDLENSKRMMGVLAHDFRSPISGVTMLLDEITDPTIASEERISLIKMAKQSLSTTLRTIDQLLFWIARDKKIISPQHVSISDVIAASLELHAIELKEKKLKINLEGCEGKTIYFDETHFQVICRNLIHNSLKNLEIGGEIKISMVEDETSQTITFEDNGPGMSEKMLADINNHRFNEVLPTRFKGSGLGLELVFDIARLNNSEIKIESELGKGTKAILTAPRKDLKN